VFERRELGESLMLIIHKVQKRTSPAGLVKKVCMESMARSEEWEYSKTSSAYAPPA